jgi:hypothetical protein
MSSTIAPKEPAQDQEIENFKSELAPINKRASVNSQENKAPKPTTSAVQNIFSGGINLFKFINFADKNRIFEAVEDDTLDIFKEYLEKYSHIKSKLFSLRDPVNRTLLHIACQKGCVSIVDYILKQLK